MRTRKISIWGQMDTGVQDPLEKQTNRHELGDTPADARSLEGCLATSAPPRSLRSRVKVDE
jgi:hypothetical protein